MKQTLLNVHGVTAKTGLSKSRIYQLVRTGKFPRPRKIEDGRVVWLDSLVDIWITERWESAEVAGSVVGSEWKPKGNDIEINNLTQQFA